MYVWNLKLSVPSKKKKITIQGHWRFKRCYIQVDISCTGQVRWQQLCSYLLLEYTERERASIPTAALLDSQSQIRHCAHNKVRGKCASLQWFKPLYGNTSCGQMSCFLCRSHFPFCAEIQDEPTFSSTCSAESGTKHLIRLYEISSYIFSSAARANSACGCRLPPSSTPLCKCQ